MFMLPFPTFRGGASIAMAVTLLGCLGCGGESLPRGAVRGRVTIGGQPLSQGRILFRAQGSPGKFSASAVIKDGAYSLTGEDGPSLGLNRVEVEGSPLVSFPIDDEGAFAQRGGAPLPSNPIPPQYNVQSALSTEIRSGENVYDVNVPNG